MVTPNVPPNPGNPVPPVVTPEMVAQMMGTIQAMLQQMQAQPQQQAEYATMIEAATKVDTLDEQIKALSSEKKGQVLILLPLLHKLAGGKVTLANNHEVMACMSQDKRVAKKDIAAFFTKEYPDDAAKAKAKTEALWKTVVAKTREYVSVKRPGEAAEEGEDTETPAPAATA